MEKISISKFKATCLSLVEHVKKTGQTIIITKRGEPIAQISPLSSKDHEDTDSFGCMSGTAKQIGDIVAPLETEDWEELG
jgi:prevent-host-death family protein